MKIVALIDGEHYPPVVRFALGELRKRGDVVAAVFVGGTEKVDLEKGFDVYGVPVIAGAPTTDLIAVAVARYSPDVFIDLSDEPILTALDRMALANIILSHNVAYAGADFEFRPPKALFNPQTPTLSIIGTGKRIGKTAVSAYIARTLKASGANPVVLAMGRGGPDTPEVIHGDEVEIGPAELLAFSKQGVHASSDNFEDAVLGRVTTVGCRRCGGGLAGETFFSNVEEGARIADGLGKEVMILEGSGAAIPPIHADATVLLVGARQGKSYITDFFGPYRLARADLVIIANAEPPNTTLDELKELREEIAKRRPDIPLFEVMFRPDPAKPIAGKHIFYATTAPADVMPLLVEHLETNHGAIVVGSTSHLSNRALLRDELTKAISTGKVEVLVTEIKAAAIDVVVEVGDEFGIETVFADNIPYAHDQTLFTESLLALVETAVERGSQ